MEAVTGQFPSLRLRRKRAHHWTRRMLAEVSLSPSDLILPIFIVEGQNKREPVASMPGVERLSVDQAVIKAKEAKHHHIPALALFPVVDKKSKSKMAKEAYKSGNLINRAIKAIKKAVPDIGIIGDVALDPYTVDGHDGIVVDGCVHNDQTVAILCKQALSLAKAGCDIVAPSDMMDGRVGAIRSVLDKHGFEQVLILSYAVKFMSHLYGPFRDAIGSKQSKPIDKRAYQLDFHNNKEAFLEVTQDIHEGADILMVKPGMMYLDVVRQLSQACSYPIFAYQVSGEYAMLTNYAKEIGAESALDIFYESLIAFKRAGATSILTYAALDIAKDLNNLKL